MTVHDVAVVEEVVAGHPVRCYRQRPRTILGALDAAVREHGDVVGLQTPEASLRNREFAALVAGAADRLVGAGVAPGDRVATCLRSGLESAVAFFACARAGAILVALNTRL